MIILHFLFDLWFWCTAFCLCAFAVLWLVKPLLEAYLGIRW